MKNRIRVATALAVTSLVTLAFSGTASAAALGTASCSTTGASGSVGVDWGIDPYDEVKLAMSVRDTLADGHHVRIRFLSKPVGSSQTFYWAWHSLTAGSGETLTFSTTAQSSYGIDEAGVQVARFEGDALLNSCTAWD
jgi:hypothetical protein